MHRHSSCPGSTGAPSGGTNQKGLCPTEIHGTLADQAATAPTIPATDLVRRAFSKHGSTFLVSSPREAQ
ncbi:hypothetical protein MJO28_012083 [Puccinia striiformis f. sp. tritici]|uniref:Uncharacterized protein n=1 Tax=Puccinia striiformis f. sp. tritici TaxID=168172 RepID=A0ACC0E045_9BASI|nr:hypothetical protein MJO28_012083 [Puccinia striiformis f. sp. tritici]KAI7945962.1 hypothetical protein MJO29_012350 [Puccinia striiformis f. sp. tritici]